MGPELTLTHAGPTPGALVPVYLADLLATEKTRGASLYDVSPIRQAVAVAVTHPNDIGCYACPNTMYQPFLVVKVVSNPAFTVTVLVDAYSCRFCQGVLYGSAKNLLS